MSARTRTFAAAGGICLLAGLPALAAVATSGPEQAVQPTASAPAAAFVAADAAPQTFARDGYAVSEYALVRWPLPLGTTVSSDFGYRVPPCSTCSSDHSGVDWTPGAGTPVAAVADGVVREVGNPSGELGVYAIVDHVIDGQLVSSVYGHLELGSLAVAVGDEVNVGDIVGAVGSTGESTGPHLHFGILLGGTDAVDPVIWLSEHAQG